jgi:hypothetical protein
MYRGLSQDFPKVAIQQVINLLQAVNEQTTPNQPPFNEKSVPTPEGRPTGENGWWAGRDLNLRPQPRKGCVLTMLDDRPIVQNYGVKCFIKNTCVG